MTNSIKNLTNSNMVVNLASKAFSQYKSFLENISLRSQKITKIFSSLDTLPFKKESFDKGELFRKFHTTKARFGQFSLKSLTNIINELSLILTFPYITFGMHANEQVPGLGGHKAIL